MNAIIHAVHSARLLKRTNTFLQHERRVDAVSNEDREDTQNRCAHRLIRLHRILIFSYHRID